MILYRKTPAHNVYINLIWFRGDWVADSCWTWLIDLKTEKNSSLIKYDGLLSNSLDFVCNIFDVTKEDFASLALANLLDEELNWIQYNRQKDIFHRVDAKEIGAHKSIVDAVRAEANNRVLTGRNT